MLNVSSGGYHIYPSNWMRICDACRAAACTLYCHTDSSYLCHYCDKNIHAADPMALPHERVWICTACQNAPAAFTCTGAAVFLCIHCDIDVNSGNPNGRVPILPLASQAYTCSSTYQYELPGTMMNTENEIIANRANEEINEDETDYWLLLELDKNDNQTNSEFMYAEVDEYLNLVEDNSCNEYLCADQSNQHQYYSGHSGDNGSDSVVPVQTFKVKEQKQEQQQQHQFNGGHPGDNGSDSVVPVQCFKLKQQQQQQHPQHHQQQVEQSIYFNREYEVPVQSFDVKQPQQHPHHQQQQAQQSIYFNSRYEASKAAFLDNPSSSQSVPMSFINAGILPEGTSDISSAYSSFPERTTDLFLNSSPLVPDQLTKLNREEKVLRYREKRKARKFPKKIRYASRKAFAKTRPRVKGRFARKTEMSLKRISYSLQKIFVFEK